jgi:hypothetical protein
MFNISLTLLGTMLGLLPVLLGGTPEQAGASLHRSRRGRAPRSLPSS